MRVDNEQGCIISKGALNAKVHQEHGSMKSMKHPERESAHEEHGSIQREGTSTARVHQE